MQLNEMGMVKLFSAEKENNFLAVAITPWHAHGVDVALLKLKDKGITPRGIVFLCDFPGSSGDLNENDFCNNFDGIQYIKCKFEIYSWGKKLSFGGRGLLKLILSGKENKEKPIFVVNPIYPNLNWIYLLHKNFPDREIKYLIIDEGCGTYTNTNFKTWIIKNSNQKANGISHILDLSKLTVICLIRETIKGTAIKKLESENRIIYNFLLKKGRKNNELIIDNEISKYYIKVFSKLNFNTEIVHDFEKSVLIVTQFLDNNEAISQVEYAIWQKIISLISSYGIKIYIKPHPRERNLKKYRLFGDVEIITDNTSLERMIKEDSIPRTVIGISSTTLITLNALWSIPTISIMHIYESGGINLQKKMNFDGFIDTFSDFVLFPKSFDELESVFNSLWEVSLNG